MKPTKFCKGGGPVEVQPRKKKIHRGGVYDLNYHLVWCPKRRSPVLVGRIAEDLKELVDRQMRELGCEIRTMEVMPDHVHLFVSAPPKWSPHRIVKKLKGVTSLNLRKKYPQLLKLPALWSSSYYVGSVGQASESVVQMYIEGQKGK